MSRKEDRLLRKIEAGREKAERDEMNRVEPKTFKDRVRGFKDFCVKDTSRMILLVAVLVAIYLVINLFLQDKNLAQIDLTTGRLHTLTDRSKTVAKTIDNDIMFYLWGIQENDEIVDLLRQFNKENDKIKFKQVSYDDKTLINKYGFEEGYVSIVATSDNGKTSYINEGELYTYDDQMNQVSLSEQRLTNSLLYLNNDKQFKVYFMDGKTAYTPNDGIMLLTNFLNLENYLVDSINLSTIDSIPSDCDVLAIFGITEDLTSKEADMIIDYISKGGDLVIAKDINFLNPEDTLSNFNRVLDEYCISLPNKAVQETLNSKIITSSYEGFTFKGSLDTDHEIVRVLKNNSMNPLMTGVGKIDIDYEKAYSNNVTPVSIVNTSTKANIISNLIDKEFDEQNVWACIGAAIIKTSASGQESRLVVFNTAESFSDHSYIDPSSGAAYPIINYQPNATIMLNSFAYVTDQGELYSIRKTSSETRFTVTQEQSRVVLFIITLVPLLVAVIGVIVCHRRRKLK